MLDASLDKEAHPEHFKVSHTSENSSYCVDVRSIIDSLVDPQETTILSPSRWPMEADLSQAVDMAEKAMKDRGIFGKWAIISQSILRTTIHRPGTPLKKSVYFSIKKEATGDQELQMALRGDLMNELEPEIIKVEWNSDLPRIRLERVESGDSWVDRGPVAESEEARVHFNPSDEHDTALYNFLVANCDGFDRSIGREKQIARNVDNAIRLHLLHEHPSVSYWAVLDYFPGRFGPWHQIILEQCLSEEEVALSGDIMNVMGKRILIQVADDGRGVLRERPTELTFLGI